MFGCNSIKEVYFGTATNRRLSGGSWSIIAPPSIAAAAFVPMTHFSSRLGTDWAPSRLAVPVSGVALGSAARWREYRPGSVDRRWDRRRSDRRSEAVPSIRPRPPAEVWIPVGPNSALYASPARAFPPPKWRKEAKPRETRMVSTATIPIN